MHPLTIIKLYLLVMISINTQAHCPDTHAINKQPNSATLLKKQLDTHWSKRLLLKAPGNTPFDKPWDELIIDVYLTNPSTKTAHDIKRCPALLKLTEDEISPPAYAIWRILTRKCQVLARFYQGQDSNRSFLPVIVTRDLIEQLPMNTIHVFSLTPPPMPQLDFKTYAKQYNKPLNWLPANRFSQLRLEFDAMEMWYDPVIRADFNEDGIEDLLLYVTWSPVDGSAAGADILIVTKKSQTAPLEVLEHIQ